MKTVVLAANGDMRVEQRPIPHPASDECLVRIHFAGVCSSDIARGFGNGAYHYPIVMGHEASGTITEVGSSVAHFSRGERVVVFPLLPCFACDSCARLSYAQCKKYDYYGSRRDGAFSEFLCVKAWNLMPVPDGVSLRDAAMTEPTAVVIHALMMLLGGECKGELLVLGCGFLGLLAVESLRILAPDMRVTVADRNAFKLALAKRFDVTTVLISDDDAAEAYVRTKEASFPFVLEAAGLAALSEMSYSLGR